jgi:hypothetical protein
MESAMKVVFALAVYAGLIGPAAAYCQGPFAPRAPYRSLTLPACLAGYERSGTHTCSDWEIDTYINAVNAYVEDLNAYVREADAYADAVYNYAKCEADEAQRLLR